MLRLLIAVFSFVLCSCTSLSDSLSPGQPRTSPDRNPSQENVTLRVATISDITNLDPQAQHIDLNYQVATSLYGRLFRHEHDKRILPQLAVRSSMGQDPKIWTFELAKNVFFHRGQSFTREDVLCSFRRLHAHSKQVGGFYSQVSQIDMEKTELLNQSAEAKAQPQIFKVATKNVFRFLPGALASVFILSCDDVRAAEILSGLQPKDYQKPIGSFAPDDQKIAPAVLEAFASGKLVNGTGPYRLVKWFQRTPENNTPKVVMEKFPGAPTLVPQVLPEDPEWERIEVLAVTDPEERARALEEGRVDLSMSLSPAAIARLKTNTQFKVYDTTPSLRLVHMQMYTGNDNREQSSLYQHLKSQEGLSLPIPFQSLEFRRALYLAIDKKFLVKNIMGGLGTIAGQYMPSSVAVGHIARIPADTFDLEKARKEFHGAAQKSDFAFLKTPSVLTFHGPNNRYPNDEKILRSLESMWNQAFGEFAVEGQKYSMKFKAVPEPKETYFQNVNKYGLLLLGGSVDNGHPEGALRLYFTNGAALNYGNYTNAKVNELYAQALNTQDPDQSDKKLIEALEVVYAEQGFLPLYNQQVSVAARRHLKFTPRVDETVMYSEIKTIK